jgi:CheY-like chemotaxis protein
VRQAASIEELVRESTGFILSGTSAKAIYSFADDLWPVDIDPGQISQVVQNLCLNANQAMPDGGLITIDAENQYVEEDTSLPLAPGKFIKITFKDAGVGVSQKNIARIFDPYFTTKQKGSGLGLATVYSIIKNHDGFITVDSELDLGTTFTFYLPASADRVEATATSDDDKKVEDYSGTGRVLVMDDEEIIRDVAGEILDHLGFDVDFALHGEEALKKYSDVQNTAERFDAVIMDLTIPGGMGGGEAIRRLLEIDPEAKVIVSSGYSNDPIMADYKKYGFKGMVGKPFQVDELQKVLDNVLNMEIS